MWQDRAFERLIALDHHISGRLSALPPGATRKAVRLVAHTGDGWPWLILSVLATFTTHEPLRQVSLRALVTIAVAGVLVGSLKLFFRRKRPPGRRDQLYFSFDHHSFPSGHAARVAALAVVIGSSYPTVEAPLAIWVLLVVLSRVAMGIHYLFDVIVGILVGIVIGDAMIRMIEIL